jgi:hypothetical protein
MGSSAVANVKGSKRAAAFIGVIAMSAAVLAFGLTAMTSKGFVSTCNTDAQTVETAVAAFQTENPNVAVSRVLAENWWHTLRHSRHSKRGRYGFGPIHGKAGPLRRSEDLWRCFLTPHVHNPSAIRDPGDAPKSAPTKTEQAPSASPET